MTPQPPHPTAAAEKDPPQQPNLQGRSGPLDTAVATEAVFRAIVEEQTELIALAEGGGRLLYVNPAYAKHFGRTPGELIGTDLFELIEPRDRPAVRAEINGVLRSGEPHRGEYRTIDAEQLVRVVSWTNSRHPQDAGPPLLRCVGRDVTQHRRAEQAQQRSEAFAHAVARVSGVGGWTLDLATQTLTWSDQTRRIHEVDSDFRLSVERALEFYAPSSRPLIESAMQRALADATVWDLELELVTARGRHVWTRAVGEAEFEGDRPVRLVGTIQDITARREMEQRLAENERFLRELTDHLPVRIAYLDRDRRYRFVNLEMARRFGRAREDVLGRTRRQLLPDEPPGEIAERAQSALAGQAQCFEFEEHVGGDVRRIENRLIPDLGHDGAVRGFFVTGIDITERSQAERAARELTAIVEHTTDFVVQTDRFGRVSYMNPAARTLLGIGAGEAVEGRSFEEFNTPLTNARYADVILPSVRRDHVWVGEAEVFAAERREISVSLMVLAHRDAQGGIERFSAVMRDISEMVEARREILRQSAILRSVADAMPAAVAVVSAQSRYRFVNQAFAQLRQKPAAEIVGLTARELLGDEEFQRRLPWFRRALAGETVDFELDYPGREQDTHQAMSYIPLKRNDGRPDGMVVIINDVSRQRREATQLRQLAQRDPLTGLLNRAGFEQAMDRVMAAGREAGAAGLAMLYIDLDRFKPVNDEHGHAVGDQLLKLFGQRMLMLVRPTDIVARLGGDEFAIALPGIRELAHAQAIADKVLAAGSERFSVAALTLQIAASVGVAWSRQPAQDWRSLVNRADAQLLRAKAGGRGRQSADKDNA